MAETIPGLIDELGAIEKYAPPTPRGVLTPNPLNMLVGQTGSIGAPAIVGKAPLFDYSKLREVPNVPQRDLPRYDPPRGVPEKAQQVAEPKNIARLNKIAGEGSKIGGLEWYNLEPLRQRFVEELGADKGNQQFMRYLQLISATSPQTRVPENIRNASYYLTALTQGKPIPERVLDVRPKGTYPIIKKGTQAPYPYSQTLPIHIQNIENILRTGGIPELANPKPASFVQNLAGNQRPVTIDTHNMRIIGEPISKDTSRIFGKRAEPSDTEYGFLERLQQAQAEKLGMTPAQYQASLWLGGAGQTGVKSMQQPTALAHIEARIAKTAKDRGQTKEQVLKDMIRGIAPLTMRDDIFNYLQSQRLA
jgi:hypothetical protein